MFFKVGLCLLGCCNYVPSGLDCPSSNYGKYQMGQCPQWATLLFLPNSWPFPQAVRSMQYTVYYSHWLQQAVYCSECTVQQQQPPSRVPRPHLFIYTMGDHPIILQLLAAPDSLRCVTMFPCCQLTSLRPSDSMAVGVDHTAKDTL